MKTKITLLALFFLFQIDANCQALFCIGTSDQDITFNVAVVDHPVLNNRPELVVAAKPVKVIEPRNIIRIPHSISTGYDVALGMHTIRYNDPSVLMQAGSRFNIFAAERDSPISLNGNFTHTATAGTISQTLANVTIIDDDLLNNNPLWKFILCLYYGLDEINNESIYNLYYDLFGTGEWVAMTQPGLNVPLNSQYNMIGNTASFFIGEITSNPGNTDKTLISATQFSHWLNLDFSSLNLDPDKLVFVEPIIPTGSTGAEMFQQTSVYYNPTSGFHELHLELDTFPGSDFNFPINKTFNVFAGDETLSVAENEIMNVKAFPNPVNTVLNIQAQNNIDEVTLLNILGQELKTVSGDGNQNLQIDMSNYETGIYLAEIRIGNKIQTVKLIMN